VERQSARSPHIFINFAVTAYCCLWNRDSRTQYSSSCHCVSPSYISWFIVFLLHLLLVYYIIITRHHVMIFTLLHHLSSVLSIPYHSHSFSHLIILVCLILATFSYRFLFYSQEIFSLILDLFLVSLPSRCVLSTYC